MPVPGRDVNGVLGLRFFSEIEFKAPVGSDRGCSGGSVGEGGCAADAEHGAYVAQLPV